MRFEEVWFPYCIGKLVYLYGPNWKLAIHPEDEFPGRENTTYQSDIKQGLTLFH